MRKVILATLFNRPAHALHGALQAARRVLPDADIVCIDDGSTEAYSASYGPVLEQVGGPYRLERIDTQADRPDSYGIPAPDGGIHNNPAYAFNRCWQLARENGPANALILSSDTIIQSKAREQLRCFDTTAAVWTPTVVDLDTGACWHHPQMPRPFQWAQYTSLDAIEAVGGMDEAFMGGIAFEDNDFSARLLLHVGRLVVRGDVTCWHQSHPQTAYSDGNKGFETNRAYCQQKWLGVVPFNDQDVIGLKPEAVSADVAGYVVYRGPRNLRDFIRICTDGAVSVVDLGARFGDKLDCVADSVQRRIAVEIHRPYAQASRVQAEWHLGDMVEWVRAARQRGETYDAGMAIDTLEHLDHDAGERWLRDCQRVFRRVLVFTPDGLIPQEHSAFDPTADEHERHRSGWTRGELEQLGFSVQTATDYHRIGGVTYGALFAVWEAK